MDTRTDAQKLGLPPLYRKLADGSITDQRPLAPKRALPGASQVPTGRALPSGQSQSRAMRRARKADRARKVEKMNVRQAKLQRENRDRLETAAALANVYFGGKTDTAAYRQVLARVERQAENLVATGKASDKVEAVTQIEDSMAETLRQHTELHRKR